MSRDTQFAGFAKKLLDEMVALHGYIDISGFWNSPDDETVQEYTQIIARRAYDLAYHTLEACSMQHRNYGMEPEIDMSTIPDLTTWPEE